MPKPFSGKRVSHYRTLYSSFLPTMATTRGVLSGGEEGDVETGRSRLTTAETLEDGQCSIISQLSSFDEAKSTTSSSQHRRREQGKNANKDDGAEGIVRAEAKIVRNLRIAMICLIISAATICGFLIYKISSKNETDAFKQSFEEAATKFTKAFLDTQAESLNYAYLMSVSISSGLYVDSSYTPSFPNVSINHLDILGVGLSHRGLINDLIWSPLLRTEEERASWESYALSNLASVSKATYPPCNVCGEGHDVVRPDALLSFPGRQITCEMLLQALVDGTTSPAQCNFLGNIMQPVCGCQTSAVVPTQNETISSEKGIFRLIDGVPVLDLGPPPYSPVWQITPTQSSKQVALFNLGSEPRRNETLSNLIEFKVPVVSTSYDPSQDGVYMLSKIIQSFGVSASFFFPVFESLGADKLVGSLVLDFSWVQLFNYIVPAKSNGVVIVLENNQGQSFTYRVVDNIVTFSGEGDLHDGNFDSEKVESSFADYNQVLQLSEPSFQPFDSTSPPALYCSYRVRLYPTDEFKSRHVTSKPAIYTVIVVLAFGLTTLLFLAYDWLVRRIQNKVLDSAKRSEAIVSSLFPALVRDRIFGAALSQTLPTTSGFALWWGRREVSLDNALVNHKARLKSYLSHPPSFDLLSHSDPIADLYPNTTVMFADIAGFTAWSSEREPSQVFKLLESLFCEFDEVARELGVFKVETMGDCYVAVTGLPEKRKDHAVVMVEFAFRCLLRMRELVSKLELVLGPGTADLSIRVGLHSGPVTAGVLRGDRARFQLFGDTLNVASRMENTSEPSRIHLSNETAKLLKESGKEYWLSQRHDLVSVKGKGDLQTFWAKPMPISNTSGEASLDVPTADGGQISGRSPSKDGSVDGTESDLWGGTSLDNSLVLKSSIWQGRERLVDWFADLLLGYLQKVVLKNTSNRSAGKDILWKPSIDSSVIQFIEEITEVIEMPEFNERTSGDPSTIELGPAARSQLRDYVAQIALFYKDNAFHNFEHACHVAMSASKLLKRIIAPEDVDFRAKSGNKMKSHKTVSKEIHESTFGISSDPLMQFAVVFSALIHDVDHTGLTNKQLVKEDDPLAIKYRGKCVAEQRSIQLAWDALMEDKYAALRQCIFRTEADKQRFRQLLVNAVIATDIADKELSAWRKNRWDKVFHDESSATDAETIHNRKATIVYEYIIQASDVAHTMQHWHVYQKWNKRLFDERYAAYLAGRESEDPSLSWHKGEIWFFDNYIIPLAKKLEECNVFGVSCDEFLTYALQNRHEWELKGESIVTDMVAGQNCFRIEHSSVDVQEGGQTRSDETNSASDVGAEITVTEEQVTFLRRLLGGEELAISTSIFDVSGCNTSTTNEMLTSAIPLPQAEPQISNAVGA